ncbi:MAG TPA: SulP family inorganic anion transporter [Phycisphaerae bacterium]|nr:SulP family inorganic anion transporter [Phycisphaerales bacterium]HRX84940.1 SulP family inorganic anion transporter [Phycisphaerae bacterium]
MSGATTQSPRGPRGGSAVRDDLLASFVVFLVALPLCMGIAVASGVPPAAGLLTGVIGGLIVGFIAGAPLQVSGPAAGLTVIVAEIVGQHGLASLGAIVLLAGLMQATAGLCRLGQVFRAVSPAVIHGMLAGIGVLIIGSQFHVMVDDPKRGSGIENLMTIPGAILKGVTPVDGSPHHIAAAIGFLTIVLIVLWPIVAPKRLKIVPAALVGVGGAAICAWVFRLNIDYVTIPDRLWDEVRWPTAGSLRALFTGDIFIAAVTIALVASAETLLCASAVDQMQTGSRTKYDRELFAQGVGNTLCGIVGALPMTGVIVRSSANVNAGGRTRRSAILHGLWLLIFVAALPDVIRLIPMAALGAMLVYTGYKLAHPRPIRELLRFGKGEVAIYLITLFTIVSFDLLTGVIAGIVASAIKLLYTFSHLRITVEPDADGRRTLLHLDGAATFIRLPRLAAALENVPANAELHVVTDHLSYIDHACLDLLESWHKQHEATGGDVVIDWPLIHARSPAANGSRMPQRRVTTPAAAPARAAPLAEPVVRS